MHERANPDPGRNSRIHASIDSGGNAGPATANLDSATCGPDHSSKSMASILAIPKEKSLVVTTAVGPRDRCEAGSPSAERALWPLWLRVGVDAKGRIYFSVGLPGTGLSYSAFFGKSVKPVFVKGVVVVAVGVVLVRLLVVWMIRAS
jgi:hypothetical protein